MDASAIIITVIAALLAAGLGYLLAKSGLAKSQSAENRTLTERINALELDNNTLSRDLSHQKTQYQQATDDNKALDQRLETARLAEQQSANELAAINAEYEKTKTEVTDLKARLSLAEQLIRDKQQEHNQTKEENSTLRSDLRGARIEQETSQQALEKLQTRFVDIEQKYETIRNQNLTLSKQLSESEERLKSQDASEKKLKIQFDEQLKTFNEQLKVFTNETLESKARAFSQSSKETIDNVLKPFKAQIEGFQRRVNEVHTETVKGNATLDAEIKKVLEVGLKMQDEASNLSTALRGDKKALGSWSEVQAELLLEMSGLHEGREFHREANYKTEDSKDQRPDFVVNLPNDKHLIVDSKMSLNAYVDATSAETEEERLMHMKAHVQAIRKHVKDLSDKNYPKLKGINCPEYVFMFIGNEPAYLAAFDHEPNLFHEAYRKGIAIVTPNTLLSSLRIVSHLWSIDKQNSNTRELAEQASKVYDKLRIFAVKMEKLGSQINTVQKSYHDSWNTLKDGNGSLSKQVAKFVDMGVAVKEKLPSSITESRDIDLLPDNGQDAQPDDEEANDEEANLLSEK